MSGASLSMVGFLPLGPVESLLSEVLARVPEEARPLYHAALANGANHLVTLVAQTLAQLDARPHRWRRSETSPPPLRSRWR